MRLQLLKPLAFFDLETTGPNPQIDRIVEIAIIVVKQNGDQIHFKWLVNPTIHIPASATAIHGITDEMVKDHPTFKKLAPEIIEVIKDCDLAGFMSNQFDIPMLYEEFIRAGQPYDFAYTHFVDVGVLFKLLAPRTLTAAVLHYLGENLEGAHGALADITATVRVLDAMLEKHQDIPNDVPSLALKSNYDKKRLDIAGKFAYREDGVEIFNFGKHKGEPVAREKAYLEWMLTSNFPEDTKNCINRMLGRDPLAVKPGPAILPKNA